MNELSCLLFLVENVSEANAANLFRASGLVGVAVASATAIRAAKLGSLKGMAEELARHTAAAQASSALRTVDAFRKRARDFVAVVGFLFRIEEFVTLLAEQLAPLLAVREEQRRAAAEGDEPTEFVEPTLETLLGLQRANFEAAFRKLFGGTHPLAKTPQETKFYNQIGVLKDAASAIADPAQRNRLIKELGKLTVPEAQDLIAKFGPATSKIRQAKIELGNTSPESLALLFGIPLTTLDIVFGRT